MSLFEGGGSLRPLLGGVGAVGLIGAELRVLPPHTILAWLLVVALDLPLPAWPTCSALRGGGVVSAERQARLLEYNTSRHTVSNLAM